MDRPILPRWPGCLALALVLGTSGCALGPRLGTSKPAADRVFAADYQAPPARAGNLPGGPPNEQFTLLMERLTAAEDDRKAMQARLFHLDQQLREKDQAIVQASGEVQEATKQIKHTREEIKRWKSDMETLRGKLRHVERENKETLEAIIKTLEKFLDSESTGQP